MQGAAHRLRGLHGGGGYGPRGERQAPHGQKPVVRPRGALRPCRRDRHPQGDLRTLHHRHRGHHIPREGYARTEKRIVEELDALGKPYIILLNSTRPDAPETKQLAEGMARDYDHTVLPVSCVDLDAEALGSILRQVLYEFPVQELDFALPRWVTMLENGHWLQTQVYDAAMQLAIVTVIGRCVGANDYDQTRYYIKKMMIISLVLCLVSNIMVYLALPLILNMYTLSEEARSITRILCTMDCIFMVFFHSFSFVFPCALRAAGDARYTMYAGAFSMFVFRCLGAYVLGTVCGLGVIGTWTAMFIDWIVRIVFFVIRYKSNKWMEYRVV